MVFGYTRIQSDALAKISRNTVTPPEAPGRVLIGGKLPDVIMEVENHLISFDCRQKWSPSTTSIIIPGSVSASVC